MDHSRRLNPESCTGPRKTSILLLPLEGCQAEGHRASADYSLCALLLSATVRACLRLCNKLGGSLA